MNIIAIISDKDLGLENKPMHNPITRTAARGIVVRQDGKIAVVHKEKTGEYKLPGGGVEKYESPVIGFEREIYEEVGCTVKNIRELGITEEHKTKNNFLQRSHIYVCDLAESGKTHYTEQELNENTETMWLTPEDALAKIENCFNNLHDSPYADIYMTKFIILRDSAVLKYYLSQK